MVDPPNGENLLELTD